ncbi:ABC transporter ATP-binding protein [Sinomonas notoginsengisoli]|uniref:ABC transporter ATP-binding protein n=1 Tax=Sinomonas notoginsengisoli TaxID=1457311 RepID=UPI001F1B5188|nr:ABC transporter ATP-binding protein [Sinomonas notoginsengisoli]
MGAPVAITGLTKSFGRALALDRLDLDVREGEVLGFLGPNGAGKSTTLRILLGLLRPDSGRVELLGGDPWRDVVALHRRVAYVPGDVSLWPSLTGGQAIDLMGRLRGGLDESRRAELIETFELDPSKRGRAYSTGNRQKVAIVAALSSHAELLILDEPTAGLDPLMEALFRGEIRREKAAGRSVLLSSHILSEVEALADRISIIRQGRVVETGTLEQMRLRTRTNVAATLDDSAGQHPGLAGIPGVEDLLVEGHRVRFSVDAAGLGAAMAALGTQGILALTVTPPSLEDLFLQHYGERIPTPGAGEDRGAADGEETHDAAQHRPVVPRHRADSPQDRP